MPLKGAQQKEPREPERHGESQSTRNGKGARRFVNGINRERSANSDQRRDQRA
jgi:hypothetical protein